MTTLFADLELARRLEGTEAHANRRFVESRARLNPGSGASWIEAGGAYALFDTVGSPSTQTFGLGIFEPCSTAILDTLDRFLIDRGAEPFHEVSPLADESALTALNSAGYEPFEFTSVLYARIEDITIGREIAPGVTTRLEPAGSSRWVDLSVEGWSEFPEFAPFLRDMGHVTSSAEDVHSFIAERDGRAIGTGLSIMHRGVVLLAGASTIPGARRQGAQGALLSHRLSMARESGATLAMMGARPGSASQRNAERHGFRVAYTRIKWRRRAATAAAP